MSINCTLETSGHCPCENDPHLHKDAIAATHPEWCECYPCAGAKCGVSYHGMTCARIGKLHGSESYGFKKLHQTKEGIYFDSEGTINPMQWPISHHDWFRVFGNEHPDLRKK